MGKLVRTEVEGKFIELVSEKVYADSYNVTLDTNFQDDLGCDSLDAIEILMEAEREFGVVVPDDRIDHIKTVREAIDLIMELDSI
jgi:acyl carrier protein